jgi:hypothetical protein
MFSLEGVRYRLHLNVSNHFIIQHALTFQRITVVISDLVLYCLTFLQSHNMHVSAVHVVAKENR